MTSSFLTNVEYHFIAGARGLWVYSYEEQRVINELKEFCATQRVTGLQWSFVRGLDILGAVEHEPLFPVGALKDPLGGALKYILIELPSEHKVSGEVLLVLTDAHLYIKEAGTRIVKERVLYWEAYARKHKINLSFVCLSPKKEIPLELERLFISIPMSLPSAQELAAVIDYPGAPEVRATLADAAVGLSLHETKITANVAIKKHGKENPQAVYQHIWDTKAKYLEDKRLIKVKIPTESWADVGGMWKLKTYIEAVTPLLLEKEAKIPPPDGFLLVGFMGNGKSLISRAVASHLSNISGRQWKYLELNLSDLYRSYIGETEEATRQCQQLIELHMPCVLRLDEVGHQFSGHGAGGRSDAGVTDRMVGSWLTWMEERKPGCLIMASTNEPEKLPPHILRAGRLSGGVWHLRLPGEDGSPEVFRIHARKYVSTLVDEPLDDIVDLYTRRNFTCDEIEQSIVGAAQMTYPKPPVMADVINTAQEMVPAYITQSEEYERITRWADKKAREA